MEIIMFDENDIEYKAEIEESQIASFKEAGFEIGVYGNQHKRSAESYGWYMNASRIATRGIRYYPAVFFYKEETARAIALGVKPEAIAPVGH